jgi:hypothetical protein
MITGDPFEMLLAAAPAVPIEDVEERRSARAAMFSGGRSRRRPMVVEIRRAIVTGTAVLATFAVVASVIVEVVTSTDSASAAAEELSQAALSQSMLRPSDHQWITANYVQKNQWTRHLTQERLDGLAEQRAEATEKIANGTSGEHIYKASGELDVANEAAGRARAQQDLKTLRQGVKIEDLPTTTIVASNTLRSFTMLRGSSMGSGGGGGTPSRTTYGSPEQKAADKILEDAMLGGSYTNLAFMLGHNAALQTQMSPFPKSVIEGLSTDPDQLRDQLAKSLERSFGIGHFAVGTPADLAVKASGIAASPFASPEQRSAAIRLIGDLDGMTVDESASDDRGRPGVGFTIEAPSGQLTLVFDRDISQLLGMTAKIDDASAFTDDAQFRAAPTFDSAVISASFDPLTVSDKKPKCESYRCQ